MRHTQNQINTRTKSITIVNPLALRRGRIDPLVTLQSKYGISYLLLLLLICLLPSLPSLHEYIYIYIAHTPIPPFRIHSWYLEGQVVGQSGPCLQYPVSIFLPIHSFSRTPSIDIISHLPPSSPGPVSWYSLHVICTPTSPSPSPSTSTTTFAFTFTFTSPFTSPFTVCTCTYCSALYLP